MVPMAAVIAQNHPAHNGFCAVVVSFDLHCGNMELGEGVGSRVRAMNPARSRSP